MKKLTTFLLFIILLSSCSPQISSEIEDIPTLIASTSTPTATLTPRPTLTPTATLIPCPSQPVIFGEVTVVFHEPMQDGDCEDIIKYSKLAEEQFRIIGYPTGKVQVNVFATPEAVTEFAYDWAKQAGCNPDSKEIIFQLWTERGFQAQGTRGAVFLLTNLLNNEWRKVRPVDRAAAITHEITQAVEINILGSCQKRWQIPDWYGHGVAEYFADNFIQEWGFPKSFEDTSGCKDKLANLRAGENCIYVQSQLVFDLLAQKYEGNYKKALDVLTEMTKGKSFNTAFYDVYKISVSAFSDEFDAYRLNGYKLIEVTPTP